MMGSGMNRRNTPRGQMSMGKGGPAIQMMEGAMQAMFAPPPPLEFKKGISKRKPPQVQGVAALLAANPDMFEKTPAPPKKEYETPRQRHARIAAAKRKAHDEELTKMVSKWDPKGDKRATSDAYKTLFVAKISYDTTEKKLRRDFERYGPINNLRMVNDEDGKPKGSDAISDSADTRGRTRDATCMLVHTWACRLRARDRRGANVPSAPFKAIEDSVFDDGVRYRRRANVLPSNKENS